MQLLPSIPAIGKDDENEGKLERGGESQHITLLALMSLSGRTEQRMGRPPQEARSEKETKS